MSKKSFKIKHSAQLEPIDPNKILDPQAGEIIADSTDKNKIKHWDADKNKWSEMGGGASDTMNLLEDPSFESGVSEWTATAGSTLSQESNIILPTVNNMYSMKAELAVGGKATVVKLLNSNYKDVDGTLSLWVRTSGNVSVKVTSTGRPVIDQTPNSNDKWQQIVLPYTMNEGTTSVEIVNNGTSSAVVYVDDVFLGAKNTLWSTKFDGETVVFTPTSTWTTNTTVIGKMRRDGEYAHITYHWKTSGVPNNSFLDLGIPAGLQIDFAKLGSNVYTSSGGRQTKMGSVNTLSVATVDSATNTVRIGFINSNETHPSLIINTTSTQPFTWAAGDYGNAEITIPIKGWKSSVAMASQANSYYDLKEHYSFSFIIDGTVSPSPVTQDLPFVVDESGNQNCVRSSTGVWRCPTPSLTSNPVCTGIRMSSTPLSVGYSPTHYIPNSSPNVQEFRLVGINSSVFNDIISITCHKTGQDAIDAFRSEARMAIKESNIVYDRDEFHLDERDTGRKWGGKAIYKKCYSGSFVTGTIFASGADRLLKAYGEINSNGTLTVYPYIVDGGYRIHPVLESGSIKGVANILQALDSNICHEYTKL